MNDATIQGMRMMAEQMRGNGTRIVWDREHTDPREMRYTVHHANGTKTVNLSWAAACELATLGGAS